jgi:hypothetical protein
MDAPITREELVHFAQQMALLAFFAGVMGSMLVDICRYVLGGVLDWLAARADRRARIDAARARAARGMGQSPMLDLSRPAFPAQGAGGELGRVSQVEAGESQAHAVYGRAVKHSDDPRPVPVDQANPFPCLKDKRANGAPALRCAHGAGGDSVETPSVLEELAPALPGPLLSAQGA